MTATPQEQSAETQRKQAEAIAREQALMKELSERAGDPTIPQLDRVEAQNRLNGKVLMMVNQQLALSGGGGSGMKLLLAEATKKVEPYAETFRALETDIDQAVGRIARMESNLVKLFQKLELKYEE